VLSGLQEAIGIAERDFRAMVIWQPKEPFSAGADLAGALGLLQAGDVAGFESMVADFQATSQRIKYALVPVVAAVRGWPWAAAASSRCIRRARWRALESYVGLVEAGVGLLPAGGGLKEIAVRAPGPPAPAATCSRSSSRVRVRGDGQGLDLGGGGEGTWACCGRTTWWCSMRTSCCTSPRQQVRAGAGRVRLAAAAAGAGSRSPATSASPPSR
jgi:hypothetical protein